MSELARNETRAVWCCSTCGAVYHKDFPRCPSDGAEVVMCDRDPLLGTAVGHYQIQQLIGEGGMGRVYLAAHATLPNKRYAFKVLLGDHAASATMRTRFTREAERASQLEHANISQVVDFGRTERGLLYIVMDYVEGPSLVTLIGETPVAPRRVIALAREICRALVYAHARGIVHRDLKPENILVRRGPGGEEVPLLVDFGLAMSVDQIDPRLTESGMTMGTPAFAAPEQLSGKPIDHRADLYALGMTMFEMLTGGVPPIEGSMMEVVASRTARDAPRVSERLPELAIPAVVDDLVARLTKKRPGDRFASASEVIEALDAAEAALDAAPAVAAPAIAPPRAITAPVVEGLAVTQMLVVPQALAAIHAPVVAPPAPLMFAALADAQTPVAGARPAPVRLSTEHVARPAHREWLAGVVGTGALVAIALAFALRGSPAATAQAALPVVAQAQAAVPVAPAVQAAMPAAVEIAPPAPHAHMMTPPPAAAVEARIQAAPSPRSVEPPRPRKLYPQLSPVEVSGS
ncbi:MAG TPA: serine/threonine-protein kinase, partial [Kofleriaceae bacterium]